NTLTISSVSITGANANQFTISSSYTSPVAIGSNTSVGIIFTPTSGGAKTATLNIYTNDPANSLMQLTLTGTGDVPIASTTPVAGSTVAFGGVSINTTSAASTVQINNGAAATNTLTISSVSITGANADQFSISSTYTSPVAIGSNTSVGITFIPTSGGAKTATLNIYTNDPANSLIQLTLTGTGDVPIASTTPVAGSTVAFGGVSINTSSAASTVQINNGAAATNTLTISSVSITGANANQFIISSSYTSPVAIGANTSVGITFTPTSGGAKTATLNIYTNDPANSLMQLTLTGTGDVPIASTTPVAGSTVPFGGVLVNTSSAASTVQINNGAAATNTLTISSVSITGANANQFTISSSYTS